MLPTLMPSVRCLTRRAVCWLLFRQERLLNRLEAYHLTMFFPSSTFYIPLEELCMCQDEVFRQVNISDLKFVGYCPPSPEDRRVPSRCCLEVWKNFFSKSTSFSSSSTSSVSITTLHPKTKKSVRTLQSYPALKEGLRGAPRRRSLIVKTRRSGRRKKTYLTMTQLVASIISNEVGTQRAEIALLLKVLLEGAGEAGRKVLSLHPVSEETGSCHQEKTTPRRKLSSQASPRLYPGSEHSKSSVYKGPSTAPVVPIRTHASKNRQPVRNNRFVNLPSEAPLQREGLTASLLQPTTCTPKPFIPAHPPRPTPPGGLHKPHNYKLAKSPLTNATRYPLPDLGSRSALGSPSLSTAPEVLKLEGSKSVPLNNLYRSLLDKEYFHPVARNVVGEMLTEDSMFLVRPSMHSQHLLTLSVSNKGKIFNFVIRSRNDTKFALGTEKPGETAFSSVEEMIQFHKREPIKVEDGSLVYLKRSPTNDLFGPARKEMTSTENCFSFRIVPKI